MTPLPGGLGSEDIYAWRLDHDDFRATWNSGEGAYRVGGRWNAPGKRVVYCAIDPSTAILEVAVHKTFRVLDTVPHVLTALRVKDPSTVKIVQLGDVPNPNWLSPGIPSAGQQTFGNALLENHAFLLIPSAVSSKSWNLMFDPVKAAGAYELVEQERFALDTRLHP